MDRSELSAKRRGALRTTVLLAVVLAAAALGGVIGSAWLGASRAVPGTRAKPQLDYLPKQRLDISGFQTVVGLLPPVEPGMSLAQIRDMRQDIELRKIAEIDALLAQPSVPDEARYFLTFMKAGLYNYRGEPEKAYEALAALRRVVEASDEAAAEMLYSIVFCQGVAALRRGENENCILCRGESSCILPISPAAVHVHPEGSRLAVSHFTEYLERFPDDLEVRWLLSLAHGTLGEYPDGVDPRFLVSLDRYNSSEFDVGRFRDIGQLVGLSRFNQGGGAILDDFDNNGLFDVVTGSFDPGLPLGFYRNTGAGTFEEAIEPGGLAGDLGGVYCVQTDYDNDGFLDIFAVRGAWLASPVRPTLLHNEGDGRFTDVTAAAGLLAPLNSISASWADFDNDGWLDLFVCCERQPSRLYWNQRDGSFREVAAQAGLDVVERTDCKGSAWIDYDNDGFPDLYLDYLTSVQGSELYHNNRNGTFTNVTSQMEIHGPAFGFSCWAWDYDNDGWLDLLATSYDLSLEDVVKGLLGEPHDRNSSRLYRNCEGQRFEDRTREAGLDMVFATMGSNFGDIDNDGFLDFYLGTGDPNLFMLVPNRLFKNVGGQRFAEVTGSSGTGHLQKGHGVAFGDWDRDGDNDIFIQMGGAMPGDRYHNILFENPGHGNNWLTLKLVGTRTNRAAIGARIKIVTAGDSPLTVYRHISSGSSFGANPLTQTIGLARTEKIALLQIDWPASGTSQVFHDLAVNQAIQITEFAEDFQKLDWQPIDRVKEPE